MLTDIDAVKRGNRFKVTFTDNGEVMYFVERPQGFLPEYIGRTFKLNDLTDVHGTVPPVEHIRYLGNILRRR